MPMLYMYVHFWTVVLLFLGNVHDTVLHNVLLCRLFRDLPKVGESTVELKVNVVLLQSPS